ncbi:histidine phosphatase family protein [Spirosoma jeollabukense]
MKTSFCIVFLLLFLSCSDPTPVLPLEIQGFDGKAALVTPSGVVKFKLNQAAKWRTTGGEVSQDQNNMLTYAAPATSGMQQVIIKHPDNPSDSLVLSIAVTPSAALFQLLRSGNNVLIFRHAAADVGSDQTASAVPDWWKSCDSKLARQLNNQGVQDAANIGKTIKRLDIPIGRMLSSEFCRAFTTASQMATGLAIQQTNELTLTVYDEANRCDNTLKLAASQPRDTKNTIFVTHTGIRVQQPDCDLLNKLQWGDAALFTINENKTTMYAGTIPVKDWTDLAQ